MTEQQQDKLVDKICVIYKELLQADELEVRRRIWASFGWHRAVRAYTDMTIEEIVSMAASTYEHVALD